MGVLKIEKDNSIKVSSNIVLLLDPDHCYIPFNHEMKLLIKENDNVLKDQAILFTIDNKEVRSPISGKFEMIKKVNTIDGETDAIVLLNDYKERSQSIKGFKINLSQYKYKDLERIFSKIYVPVLDDDLTSVSISNQINTLIIDGINKEPYVANNSALLNNKLEDLLETVNLLINILKIKKTYIAVNNFETDLIVNLLNVLGTYPQIELKLIENTYPIIMKKYFKIEDWKETKIINIPTLNAIDLALRKETSVSEKLITITGNGITEPKLFLVKIGSNIKEIISNNIKFRKGEKIQIIVNGLMKGLEFPDLDLIITQNFSSIILNKEIKFDEKDCINCGACLKVCPIKNNPKFIKDFTNSKTSKKQKDLCINCNACSYVCPVGTNFKEVLKPGDNSEK